MNQTSNSADELASRVEDALNDFAEKGLGIGRLDAPEELYGEAKRLLYLPKSERDTMTSEQCYDAALVLSQFAFQCQRVLNRVNARAKWAEDKMRRTVAPVLEQYAPAGGYTKFEEKMLKAVADNDHARRLDYLRAESQLKAADVDHLPFLAGNVAKMYLALAEERRKQKYA